jgi:hypothetical protein
LGRPAASNAWVHQRTREDFRSRTGLTFDPVGVAECAADMTIGLILNRERCARLVQYHAEDASLPALEEVIDKLLASTWKARPLAGLTGEVQRVSDSVVLYRLMALAADTDAPAQVRATAGLKLSELRVWLASQAPADREALAMDRFAAAQIKRFEDDPSKIGLPKPPTPPPGMPIGDDGCSFAVW